MPGLASGGGTKAIVAALVADLGIAVTKLVAWALTGSSSMLAEAIHSVADSGNQVLLLVGGRRARRAATPEHPFGYGRERHVYAFIVSIVLFSVGGLFAPYEAWDKYQDPHPIEGRWWWVPIAVLVAAIVRESFSFRTAKEPELPVILLEDLGALVGLVLALFGVSMTLLTADGLWDAAGTAMIVRALEAAIPGGCVESIIHMKTLHLGPEELLVGAEIAVSADDAAEHRIREAVPIARVIYLEPALRR